MASPTTLPIDPADEARRLADLFSGFSDAVDDFRRALPDGTSPQQLAELKVQAQRLEDQSHAFTAEAIGLTLQAIQNDLAKIKAVTTQAKEQLKVLNDISKVASIAGSAIDLGAAIIGGDPATILGATETLAQSVAG